ncbi:MAG TPA: hypothetical protein VG407_03650 [Caulobacteraceae bacterium]|jgi:opacity protein-like surface antigen|nr:hypothetical protein [Caulobacteraceae bacterium]
MKSLVAIAVVAAIAIPSMALAQTMQPIANPPEEHHHGVMHHMKHMVHHMHHAIHRMVHHHHHAK